jgi:hypothetical protein
MSFNSIVDLVSPWDADGMFMMRKVAAPAVAVLTVELPNAAVMTVRRSVPMYFIAIVELVHLRIVALCLLIQALHVTAVVKNFVS